MANTNRSTFNVFVSGVNSAKINVSPTVDKNLALLITLVNGLNAGRTESNAIIRETTTAKNIALTHSTVLISRCERNPSWTISFFAATTISTGDGKYLPPLKCHNTNVPNIHMKRIIKVVLDDNDLFGVNISFMTFIFVSFNKKGCKENVTILYTPKTKPKSYRPNLISTRLFLARPVVVELSAIGIS